MASQPKRFFNNFSSLPALLRGNENIIVVAFIITIATFAIMSFSFILNSMISPTSKHHNDNDTFLRGIRVYGLFSGSRLIALRIDTEVRLDVDAIRGIISYKDNSVAINYHVSLTKPIVIDVGGVGVVYCYGCCNFLSSYKGYVNAIKQNISIIVIDSFTGERKIKISLSSLNTTINFSICEDFIKFCFSRDTEGLILLSYAVNNVIVLGELRGNVTTFYLVIPQRYGYADVSSIILKMGISKDGEKYMVNLVCSKPEKQHIQGFEWTRVSCQVEKAA